MVAGEDSMLFMHVQKPVSLMKYSSVMEYDWHMDNEQLHN